MRLPMEYRCKNKKPGLNPRAFQHSEICEKKGKGEVGVSTELVDNQGCVVSWKAKKKVFQG